MHTFALFGCGRIGQIHGANVAANPNCHLKYVVDVYQPAAEVAAAAFHSSVTTVEEALADPEVDAVLICTATEIHADLIIQSAHAGKAIFCEKPVDLNIDRVRQCLSVVKECNVPLMMGFNRRFDPNFAHLKNTLEQKAIGQLEMLTIVSRDPGAPPVSYIQSSGGLFRDMTIHDFDIARWLLDEEPVSVYASAAALVSEEIKAAGDVDTAVVTLTCASGKIAVITNSRRATYGYDQRVEVHGSKGMLEIKNVPESTLVVSNDEGVQAQKPMHFFLERYAAAYKNELECFVEGLSTGSHTFPSGDDGEKALLLADAALASLKSGQVVNL